MSIISFLIKLWKNIQSLFTRLPSNIKSAIHIAVLVTENIKTFVDSSTADVLTLLIPGDVDDKIKALLSQNLSVILTKLRLADDCKTADAQNITLCAIKTLQNTDNINQKAFLHSLSVMIAQIIADGKLSWSDAVFLTEWYYQQKFKSN